MEQITTTGVDFFRAFWSLLVEMAPYLWAGFAITFFLKRFVDAALIRKHLGGEGLRPVVIATLAGLPLPLCSCGVLPVAAAIRREGGSRASVAAFTVSTPQTGVDSVLATASLLGWGMAVLRLFTALISGLLAGFFVSLSGKKTVSAYGKISMEEDDCCGKEAGRESEKSGCCEQETGACESADSAETTQSSRTADAAQFAFVRLPADIGAALLFGTVLAALVVMWTPDWSASSIPGGNWGAYLLVSLFALPVYVCSTGVIPLAFGLIAAGFPAGAAFILLAAGPSVSATSLTTLGKLIGWRSTLITAGTMLTVTWVVGALIDFSVLGTLIPDCAMHEMDVPLWKHVAAAGLLVLLLCAKIREARSGA